MNGLTSSCPREGEMSEGDECKFSCDNGAQLVGPNTLTCHDGEFPELETIGTPSCEFKFCKNQSQTIKGGKIQCNMVTNGVVPAGQTCDVVCDEGFKPLGNKSVTCGLATLYNGNIGRCQKMVNAPASCPALESVLNPAADLAAPPRCVREKVSLK